MSKEITSPHKPKVIISKELAAQIQYTHRHCPLNKEWSGLLIYQVQEGSLTDLANLRIKAHALFPMDFGDSTFTSFEGDESWLTCFRQFPQVDPINPKEGWYIGKLHDHPNFNVFHSGTDKSDLYETAPKLPLFLSLIVNYATETDCELAISIEVEEEITQKTKWRMKGLNWEEKAEEKVNKESNTYVMKCDVEYEQDEWFKTQIEHLKTKPKTTSAGIQSWKPKNNNGTGTVNITSVRKHVLAKILDNFSELVTLGETEDLAPLPAMNKANDNTEIKHKELYKKAVKMYFCNEWYLTYFYNMDTEEKEVIQGVKNFLSQHTGWVVTTLTEAFNELETEYTKLRTIQGNTLVY